MARCGVCPVELEMVHPDSSGYRKTYYGVLIVYCTDDGSECAFDEEYPRGGECQPEPYLRDTCSFNAKSSLS